MGTETVQLFFQPGDRRKEGFRWASSYQNLLVGLCSQRFCELCDLTERSKLRGFRGGKLEVRLVQYRRPSFFEEKLFYLAHLIRVVPVERVLDEGLEADFSRLNAVLYRTPEGAILVDPGIMGFDAPELSLRRIIEGENILASVITHGHLDHWSQLGETRGDVFMSCLTHQLAARHANWQGDDKLVSVLRGAEMITPGQPVLLDTLPVKIDTFPLAHSIPETMGLVIRGPRARVVHLGDFKFNGMSPRSKARTIGLLRQIAQESVDVLALNILNAHIEGFTPIEALVIDALTDIIARAEGRVIISCFSTNLERISRLVEVAQYLDRPVFFFGAGMQNCQDLLNINNTGAGDLEKAVIFVTGCQAEEESVLWRVVQGQGSCSVYQDAEYCAFSLRNNDVLVFLSRCIPGNEENLRQLYQGLRPLVGRLIVSRGEAKQLGVEELKVEEAFTHVSGHESKEGIRLVLEILKPRRVLPWPQISPQIEAFREIVQGLPFSVEIIDEEQRVIEV